MQWENCRRQGLTVAVDDLCADTPELREQLQRRIQDLSPAKPQSQPRFLPQDGLGVYLFRASAWFRSCTIEALPDH